MTATLTRVNEQDWRYLRHPHWCWANAPEPDDCAEHQSPLVTVPATGGGFVHSVYIAAYPTVRVQAHLPTGREWRPDAVPEVLLGIGYPVRLRSTEEVGEEVNEVGLSVADAARLREALVTVGLVTVTGVNGVPYAGDVQVETLPHPGGPMLRFSVDEGSTAVLRPNEAVQVAAAIQTAIDHLTEPQRWWTFAERMTPAELSLTPYEAAVGVAA